MMHQAVGLVPSEKGTAEQETTTVSRAYPPTPLPISSQ